MCVCLLCSPKRSPREILLDQDATNNIFKQKYPKAKEEMEEKLQVTWRVYCVYICLQMCLCSIECSSFKIIYDEVSFSRPILLSLPLPSFPSPLLSLSLPRSLLIISSSFTPSANRQEFLTKYSESNLQFSDSNINFGRHQILECARGALEKSKENALSKDQVIAMCDSLEGTLVEVRACVHTCTCRYIFKLDFCAQSTRMCQRRLEPDVRITVMSHPHVFYLAWTTKRTCGNSYMY